jgi:polygalacturonase
MKTTIRHLLLVILSCPVGIFAGADSAGIYDVSAFGVLGDGTTLDTAGMQAAIDACHGAGGGTVWVGPGRYLTGTLTLKSGVTLHLARGAVLVGSTNLDDYPKRRAGFPSYTDKYTDRALIYAEGAREIAVSGEGAIDGQGAAFSGEYLVRPYMLRFVSCEGVSLEDVTLRDGPMWTVHVLACDRVYVRGITIRSRCNKNNDGLDIDSSSNVRISDCDISSGDDAIVLKSTSARPCRNVTITNCVLSTDCNAIKMGTESNGGFQNIAISNCAVYDTRLSGIALEIVDGGVMDGIAVSNITMQNTGGPVFIRLGNRARPYQEDMPPPGMGTLRNIALSNIIATGAGETGCSITGLPGHPVEHIVLRDVHIEFAGGGTHEQAERVPEEKPESYPEYKMFGPLPAYGFYLRHAKGIRMDGISLTTKTDDARPAIAQEDVENLTVNMLGDNTGVVSPEPSETR